MRIKDLKKGLQNEMDALVPDVLSKVKAVPITNMLQHGTSEQQMHEKLVMRMLFATCCMFFSVLIVTAAFFVSNFIKPPTGSSMTYAYMYVAPAVGEEISEESNQAFELKVIINTDNTVRFVDAASPSDNSVAIVSGLEFKNKNFKEVLSSIMKNAYALGWFDTGESTRVYISTLNDDDGVARQIRNEASSSLKRYFALKDRELEISVSQTSKTGLYEWADGLSKGNNVTMSMGINELISYIETAKHYAEQE